MLVKYNTWITKIAWYKESCPCAVSTTAVISRETPESAAAVDTASSKGAPPDLRAASASVGFVGMKAIMSAVIYRLTRI